MKSKVSLLLACLVIAVGAAVATSGRATSGDTPAAPAIGAVIEDFTLPDTDGKDHSLASLKGKNGSVLIFISVQCPVSNAYNERMEKLAQDFAARGVAVIGINANVTEPAAAVKAHAAEHHLSFPILKDQNDKIADMLGATKTPEAYLLDSNNKLLYHGRVDNSKEVTGVSSSELREAIESMLAGKPIEKTTAMAFGCTIKRAE